MMSGSFAAAATAAASTTSAHDEDSSTTWIWATYGSHVAAIVVGVIVTLIVVSRWSSSGSASSSSTFAVSNNKKKKKNKKKGNAAATAVTVTVAAAEENETPANAANNGVLKVASQNGNNHTNAAALITSKALPSEPLLEASKGKKSKKKNNNNNTSNKNTNGDSDKKNGKANGTIRASNQALASTTLDSSSSKALAAQESSTYATPVADYDWPQTTQPQQEEDVWETIPDAKSKKKKKPGPTANTAAVTAAKTPSKLSDVVAFDAKKVGIIIGPKGATMQAIQAATGCKLEVNAPPKDEKPNPRTSQPQQATVTISEGSPQAMAKAKQAVLELASRGYATLLQADTFGEQSCVVHPKVLSQIVGPNGRTIQAIQNALNVKIAIPKTDWKPGMPQIGNAPPTCKVGIAGDDKANVKQAKQVLQYLLQYHHHEITHPGIIHEEVYVPPEFFHCVIGPRGSEIKHIRGNFKVELYMPTSTEYHHPQEQQQENAIVVGKQANVDKAIQYIQRLMDRDTEQRSQKYNDEYYG